MFTKHSSVSFSFCTQPILFSSFLHPHSYIPLNLSKKIFHYLVYICQYNHVDDYILLHPKKCAKRIVDLGDAALNVYVVQ